MAIMGLDGGIVPLRNWYTEIHKKGDYSSPRSFRPISLTSFSFKVLEKLEKEQVPTVMKPLHRNQHAFKKGYSTDLALSSTVNYIERALLYTVGTFLDIKGTYDTTVSCRQ